MAGVTRRVASAGYGVAELTALPAGARLPSHSHDAPYLSIHLLGRYREIGDDQDVAIAGPAAVFHPAGAEHEDTIGVEGLRTLVIQFDPDWLDRRAPLPGRSMYWTLGPVVAEARQFARAALSDPAPEAMLAEAAGLIAQWGRTETRPAPAWLSRLDRMLDDDETPGLDALARRLDLSPPWLLRAYRAWRGEGLGDTLRRRALERALSLIDAHTPLADAAAAAGFCDQSHLNRVCKALTGETPGQIRAGG